MTAREAVSFSARFAEVTQDTAARVAHRCGALPRFLAWRVVLANHTLLASVATLAGA